MNKHNRHNTEWSKWYGDQKWCNDCRVFFWVNRHGEKYENEKHHISIPRPHVPSGPKHMTDDESDIYYLRDAARKLEEHYKPFGSNLRATVVKLLRDTADAIEEESNNQRRN